jgi:methylated-DNA-protein-cysteine methyltransferase related protein
LNRFTQKVIETILSIPHGRVMTYGQIARCAGSPRAARQVVRILHSMSEKYQLPWHRVINSKGEIGFQDEEMFLTQKLMLESEGIQFKNEKTIKLEQFRWETDFLEPY